jgi:hypothetical protein
LIQFAYDLRIESGYTASPYRKARVKSASGTIQPRPENHPRTRNRSAATVRYNYYMKGISTSTSTSFRAYYDSWAVKSATIETRISRNLTQRVSLALSLRYYYQMKAAFYEDIYDADPGPFYTGNKTLATYYSYQVGLRPTFSLSENSSFFAKAEYYVQNFSDHTDIKKVADLSDDVKLKLTATVFGLGFNLRF